MTDQMIKKTNRRIVKNYGYGGVCHDCNSPVAYDEEMLVIEIAETNEYWLGVPVDAYECPYCSKPVSMMKVYKSLEVSKELSKV